MLKKTVVYAAKVIGTAVFILGLIYLAELFRLRTLAEKIAECGFNAEYVDFDITAEHFPSTGKVADVSAMLTVGLKDLGGGEEGMTFTEAKAAIGRLGYRPASLAELLVYVKAGKWQGGDDFIFAPGSTWLNRGANIVATPDFFSKACPGGCRYVPYLFEDNGQRGLYLYMDCNYCRLEDPVRFLVVRE